MSEEETILSIKKRIFLGVVPIRFLIDEMDIPLCLNVPRCISIGLYAYTTFQSELGENCNDLWFSIDNKPIKWQYPIGVIYDSYISPKSQFQPLTIQIKKSNFPKDFLKCDNPSIPSFYFRHSFKESTFVISNSLLLLQQNMGIQSLIEESVIKQDFNQFLKVIEPKPKNFKDWNKWPIKIFESEKKEIINCYLSIEDNQKISDVLEKSGFLGIDSIIIHGINIDSNTLLSEIIPILINPDGFIYFII